MNAKILLIEDDDGVRSSTKTLLERKGYTVITASNGKKGLELTFTEKPDLIICDIKMPQMNGYDVINILKRNTETLSIPFIFLTARSDLQDIRFGMQLGADDYIMKPYQVTDLLESVKLRIEKSSSMRKSEIITQDYEEKVNYNNRIFLEGNNTLLFANVNEITHIVADNQYSKVHLQESKTVIIQKALKQWENLLPSKDFLRIHRSYIINLNYIELIERYSQNTYAIKLKNIDKSFISSRRYSAKMREMKLTNHQFFMVYQE